MTTYWLIYLIPFSFAFSNKRYDEQAKTFLLAMFGIFLIFIIGLRERVGGDWLPYLLQYQHLRSIDFFDVFLKRDPGYIFFNWFSAQLGWGIYGTNLMCAIIFTFGLLKFCRIQFFPWLACAFAIPYLTVIVAMGSTRQSVALGLVFWGLSYLQQGKVFKYFMLVCFGTLFHKSALVMLPFIFFTRKRINLFHLVVLIILGTLIALKIIPYFIDYWTNYVIHLQTSKGGTPRIWMNVIPVLMAFFFHKSIKAISPDYKLWQMMSLAILVCIPVVEFASTATDRVATYFSAIQLVLWTRIVAVQSTPFNRSVWVFLIISYYALAHYVWLNYAVTKDWWVPYNNILL